MGKPDIGPFLMVIGGLLLAWGIAGWFVPFEAGDTVATDMASNLFYTLLGPLLVWSGYAWSPNVRHDWTTNVGFLFLLLAIGGFAVSGRDATSNLWVTNLETAENVAHLVLGVLMVLGGRRILTEEVYVIPRRYRPLMATRAVRK